MEIFYKPQVWEVVLKNIHEPQKLCKVIIGGYDGKDVMETIQEMNMLAVSECGPVYQLISFRQLNEYDRVIVNSEPPF